MGMYFHYNTLVGYDDVGHLSHTNDAKSQIGHVSVRQTTISQNKYETNPNWNLI